MRRPRIRPCGERKLRSTAGSNDHPVRPLQVGRWSWSRVVPGRRGAVSWTILLWLWIGARPALGQWLTQEIPLRPGWNAVHLQVQPEPRACEAVFDPLPVEGVWQWNRRFLASQFITDPQSPLPESPDWLVWLPSSHPRSFLNRLSGLEGNQSYLIQVASNAPPFTLRLKGRVVLPRPTWFPHGLNLVGLPVHPVHPPSFTEFFRFTPEVNTSLDFANELYRIDEQARGVRIVQPVRERILPGVAYWVACARAPAFLSALHVTPPGGALDFGDRLVEQELRLQNVHPTDPLTVTLRLEDSEPPPVADGVPELAGAVPLSYLARTESNSWAWTPLPAAGLSLTLEQGEERAIRLGLRRADLPAYVPQGTNGAAYQGVLHLTDSAQSLQIRVPVTAGQPHLGAELGAAHHDYEGLWVGLFHLNQVNAPAYTNGLLKTPAPLTSRLLLHVDGKGTAHLLQQVLLAWDSTLTNSVHTNGSYALFASEGSLPAGATQVSRISSVSLPTMTPVVLHGSFGDHLTGTVTVASNDPSNPFLHRYHPLHDNRDAQGVPYTNAVEVPAVGRDFSLTFQSRTNFAASLPDSLDTMNGTYAETLLGLRAQPVQVQGSFSLRRISQINQLHGITP